MSLKTPCNQWSQSDWNGRGLRLYTSQVRRAIGYTTYTVNPLLYSYATLFKFQALLLVLLVSHGIFFCTKSQRVCEEFIFSLLRLIGYRGLVTVTKDLIIDRYHAASILVIFLVSNYGWPQCYQPQRCLQSRRKQPGGGRWSTASMTQWGDGRKNSFMPLLV